MYSGLTVSNRAGGAWVSETCGGSADDCWKCAAERICRRVIFVNIGRICSERICVRSKLGILYPEVGLRSNDISVGQ